MHENYFRQLLENYITGQISKTDQKKFFDLLEQREYQELLEQVLREEWDQNSFEEIIDPNMANLVEYYVLDRINKKNTAPVRVISFFRKYTVAAAVVVLLIVFSAVSIIFVNRHKSENEISRTKQQIKQFDVPPGSIGAILTLNNGNQIVLDSVHTGLIAQQGASRIVKVGDRLSYNSKDTSTDIIYNTISTPKGKQFPNLILADGSKVWLDAGSSIRFPVSFVGNERTVEITGQAWFDVVHNSKMPFKVIAKGTEIVDLGTEFNVTAYNDEPQIKITLLKGSIRIQSKILKPGQQAIIAPNNAMQIVNNSNIDEAIAWKNGFFSFKATDVKGIMRQLSRWYDVDVRYEGVDPTETFSGKIDRNLPLSEVLKILKKTRVHFRIEEGKKLIIQP